ncbi:MULTISPECIES: 16S rRNA (uracil(1498)-N(3))-methyltransferase [unclassified Acinetobacter]|uniref:16S rRNA (uracil(1498)-N(3))-methyltransferase n=1 Tax=unclassified Acinetobacter TaxID=196816 RepID=UPI0035B97434
MNRFFIADDFALAQSYTLPENVFHHWTRVLRAKVGEQAIVFNGKGGEYFVELSNIDKKSAQVNILDFYPKNRNLAVKVTLGQVMSKGDRMDYAIQKATELGVHQIQLLTSERCEMRLKYDRDQKKIEHWQAVAIAACEQCGLNLVPEVLAPMSVQDWTRQVQADLKLVLALSDGKMQFAQPLPQNIALLVGAEGGLSDAEITDSVQQGFVKWTIGKRVLRTETAPVAALGVLNFLAE